MHSLQIVFSILALFLVPFVAHVTLHRKRLIKAVKDLNSIPLDRLPQLFNLNFNNTIDIVRSLADVFPIRGWLSPFQMIVAISDPDDVQLVLSNPTVAEKAYFYKFFQNDHGLLTSQHHIWKVHRKILNPAFAINNIRANVIPVFQAKTDLMLQRMRGIEDNTDCQLVNYIKFCLLETSLAAFTGEECDAQVVQGYANCMSKRIESVARRFLNLPYHWDTIYKLTRHHRAEQKYRHYMRGVVQRIVNKRRANPQPGTGKMIIDLLISRLNEGQITERDVVDELDTMLYTSVDTSTHLIVFTLLMIAMNPAIQEALVSELQSVFTCPDVPCEYDQLKNLSLLDRVIKETVRIYPIVPFAIKVAKEPMKLSNCTVPTGALTLISIMSIHESKKLWGPNAMVFNPDNFLPENVKNRHPYAFIPFSLGRNCIGMVYGRFQMTCLIARMLMEYKIETNISTEKDIQAEYKITLNLKNEKPFRLIKRKDFYNINNA